MRSRLLRSIIVALALTGDSPGREVTARAEEPSLVAVRFAIRPAGARLLVDDHLLPWFGTTLFLEPGRHHVAIDVPDSRCCPPLDTTIEVKPAAGEAQRFVFSLLIRPAGVTLVEAPEHAELSCPRALLRVAAGGLAVLPMQSVVWEGTCFFESKSGASREERLRLRAGEVNAIRWPNVPDPG